MNLDKRFSEDGARLMVCTSGRRILGMSLGKMTCQSGLRLSSVTYSIPPDRVVAAMTLEGKVMACLCQTCINEKGGHR
jgi:hypothetical protein